MPHLRSLIPGALFVALAIAFAAAGFGADADPIASALGKEIIGARQTLAEVKSYALPLVPKMPALTSVEAWEAFAAKTRAEVFQRVIFRGQAETWRSAKTRVEWLDAVETGPGYTVKKLRYEALPGLWIPALLYEPEKRTGAMPVVLNVNGHDGKGKAADYKQIRCVNLARRGMLALNIEWFGMGQFRSEDFRHDLINHIDLTGSSGIATHYLAMTRGIDLLLSLPNADPKRVAVTGLSGGGWQTIFVSAFDTRVTLTNPVAGYSSFTTRIENYSDLGDSEQTPCDLASVTDYAIMTAMMAPRSALLTFNAKDDCCFAAPHALPPLLETAGPVFKLFGREARLRSHINLDPGTHNYQRDNREAFYRMAGDTFFAHDPKFDAKEIPSDKEVKTLEQLTVPLPTENQSLHGLAMTLSKSLPHDADLPKDKDAARAWVAARRETLREVVRAKRHDAHVTSSTEETKDGVKATFWRLKVGEWSLPVVELVKDGAEAKSATILVGDKGRKELANQARSLLDAGDRVFAVDPFYVGESRVIEKDYLFALLLASLGDRPLGLQATELSALARWAKAERNAGSVAILAEGPRTSVMALVAAGLEPDAIASLLLHDSHGSLKELIESKASYNASPELFCFGLLESFDILQLAALAAPRPVVFSKPSDRAKKNLAGLKSWYATWGVDLAPLQ